MSIDKIWRCASFFVLVLLSSASIGTHASGSLDDKALNFITERWQLTNPELQADSSVSIVRSNDAPSKCNHEPTLRTTTPIKIGKNYVQISCTSPYWVQQKTVQLKVFQQVWALRSSVIPNQVISAENAKPVRLDIGSLTGGFIPVTQATINVISKRHLKAGTVLKPNMIKKPTLIQRGDTVKIHLFRQGIHVEYSGIALEKGHLNQVIRVRSGHSKKAVKAKIVKTGVVHIQ